MQSRINLCRFSSNCAEVAHFVYIAGMTLSAAAGVVGTLFQLFALAMFGGRSKLACDGRRV